MNQKKDYIYPPDAEKNKTASGNIFLYISSLPAKKESHEKLYKVIGLYLKENSEFLKDMNEQLLTSGVSWQLEKGQYGKPYFAEAPWLHFSISHSGRFWVCAVSDQPVGIDLQERKKYSDKKKQERADRIAERFFHPFEKEYLDNGGNFHDVWAAKESYVKFTGRGIGEGFDEFSTVDENGALSRILTEDGRGPLVRLLPFEEDYSLCLCAEEIKRIHIRTIHEEK